MAQFIDHQATEKEEQTEDFASLDGNGNDLESQTVIEEPTPEKATGDDDDENLPEKYRGKSAKEIAKMHMEAEKVMSRHGSEVGELRTIVDTFIKTQLDNGKKPQKEEASTEDDDLDYFTDPKKAISKALDSHPDIRQAREIANKSKMQEAKQTVFSKHPDAKAIVSTPEFQNWVNASIVRKNLYALADAQFDPIAADELLSTWKERQQAVDSAKNMANEDRKQALKSASTGGSAKGSGEPSSKKTYRRADIINLLQTNPDRYNQLYNEISLAYKEGRVK